LGVVLSISRSLDKQKIEDQKVNVENVNQN